uniref:Ribulose-5-phosphate 3-epimerase n=1 Tax=Rhodopseudomonas palustris (strain BisA53) TaxID=316055 RepID=Q07U53_RHOP5
MRSASSQASIHLLPSLMCLSPLDVRRDLETLCRYFDEVHVDIMDGHFCNSIHLSPSFVRAIRSVCSAKIDVHLMVENPEMYVDQLVLAGASSITFHVEAVPRSVNRLIARIRQHGVGVGLALCPSTSLQVLDDLLPKVDRITILGVDPGFVGQEISSGTTKRIQYASELRRVHHAHVDLCVDGGVRWTNWRELAASGADSLILGYGALFDKGESVQDACISVKNEFGT